MEQPLPFTTQDYFDEMSSPSEASIDYSDFEHVRFELGDERADLADGGTELEDGEAELEDGGAKLGVGGAEHATMQEQRGVISDWSRAM